MSRLFLRVSFTKNNISPSTRPYRRISAPRVSKNKKPREQAVSEAFECFYNRCSPIYLAGSNIFWNFSMVTSLEVRVTDSLMAV